MSIYDSISSYVKVEKLPSTLRNRLPDHINYATFVSLESWETDKFYVCNSSYLYDEEDGLVILYFDEAVLIYTNQYAYEDTYYPHTLDEDGNVLFKTSQRLIEGIREAWCINTQEICKVGYISVSGGKMYVRQYDEGWSWDIGEVRY